MTKIEFIEKYGEEAYKQYQGKIREAMKQYRERYREELKEHNRQYMKQYREDHKAKFNERNRKKKCMFAYCITEEIEQIENYELAKKDNFNGWHIHHRLECIETGVVVNSSRQDLIDWGIYYNRPASELIFLTNSEHRKLHNRAKLNSKVKCIYRG